MRINHALNPDAMAAKIERLWDLSARKIRLLEHSWSAEQGAPVFTVEGRYTARGWTEWTQGFQFGSQILQFDATGDTECLRSGRQETRERMAPHVTHFGVHDHGFNNVSTYGNLWRLMRENRIEQDVWELAFYELALKASAAVQARRWTRLPEGGFIYSFNGPHSLFSDTIRSLRVLGLGHLLGHYLMEDGDQKVSLLGRLVEHAAATAKYNVYYGEGRDLFDIRGRVVHESIFNLNDGAYRCPSSQQGFSPFSTWTRGLAWIMAGFSEQLEFLETVPKDELDACGGLAEIREFMKRAALAASDFYIENTPADGVPYWDTAAPGLVRMPGCLERPADPFNDWEPVDSSAGVIAAQGLLRLGHYLIQAGEDGSRYWQAGLTVLDSILDEPYLSVEENHQGLVLHSVYHRPNGWDHIPEGRRVPCGESTQWGDYHAREVALYVQRILKKEAYHTFFGPA